MSTSPIIAGHRGFKGKYPENTILGFNKCYDSGATVIETDLWLTKDGVVVISHDGNTARIFVDQDGKDTKYPILDTNYHGVLEHLKEKETGEQLHTFKQVLEWFVEYNGTRNDLVLQLDIKRPNPSKLIKFIIKDLLVVKNDIKWWYHRLQLGIWDLKVIKYLNQEEYFKDIFDGEYNDQGYNQFDIFHISLSWRDSVHYINYNLFLENYICDLKSRLTDKQRLEFKHKVTGVSLIYITTWSTEFLLEFMPLLKLQDMKLYLWTINTAAQFDYLVKIGETYRIREYGVVTDKPDFMVERKHKKEELAKETTSLVDKVTLTFTQKLAYKMFAALQGFSRAKRVTNEEMVFNSYVDGDATVVPPAPGTLVWIFQTFQKWGIF